MPFVLGKTETLSTVASLELIHPQLCCHSFAEFFPSHASYAE